MSRKREQQREQKRELARQLGVGADEVPEELRAHARVTEPEVKLALDVARVKRGLLTRAGPLALHVAVFVVDASGARFARGVSAFGKIGGEGAVALVPDGAPRGPDKLRYTRPGHFVVVALLTEGAEAERARVHAAALESVATVRVRLGTGEAVAIAHASLARAQEPAACTLDGVVAADESLVFQAAAVVTVASAHRVSETLALPLVTGGDKLRATAAVSVRL